MQPYQIDLMFKTFVLLGVMTISAGVSAYVFRKTFTCGFIAGAFVATLAMIVVAAIFHDTQSPFIAFALAIGLGATIGADLGGFSIAVAEKYEIKNLGEVLALTLGTLGVITVTTAVIGLFTGFNFQGYQGMAFMGLLGVLGISILMIFARLGKIMEMIVSLCISAFFVVLLVLDFNRIVYQYHDSSWGAAVQIATKVFLDLVNIFVRLLPIFVQIFGNKD